MIVEGINEKKGEDVIIIDLRGIDNSPCSYFVICSANSTTHISAISNNIEKKLFKENNRKIWKQEGIGTNWQLLDYEDIVIHVFKKETRKNYAIEELWGDGKMKKIH